MMFEQVRYVTLSWNYWVNTHKSINSLFVSFAFSCCCTLPSLHLSLPFSLQPLSLSVPFNFSLPPNFLSSSAAELVVHGERVNRHADAIAEALAELKEAPATITAKLEEKVWTSFLKYYTHELELI